MEPVLSVSSFNQIMSREENWEWCEQRWNGDQLLTMCLFVLLFSPSFHFTLGMSYPLKKKSLRHHQFSLKPFPLGAVFPIFPIRWHMPCLPGGVGFEMLNNSWWSSEWNRIQSAFYLHGNCTPRKFHVHKHCEKMFCLYELSRVKFSTLIMRNSFSNYMVPGGIFESHKGCSLVHCSYAASLPCPLNAKGVLQSLWAPSPQTSKMHSRKQHHSFWEWTTLAAPSAWKVLSSDIYRAYSLSFWAQLKCYLLSEGWPAHPVSTPSFTLPHRPISILCVAFSLICYFSFLVYHLFPVTRM